jgi:hypothetical protein
MIAAHPDQGGTPARFIAARRAQQVFEAEERAWYAVYELKPPRRQKGRKSK